MPVKLSDLRNDQRQIHLNYAGLGTLNVTVRPHRFNDALQKRYEDAAADSDYETMADALGELIVEWDLQGDDGEELPIDAEAMQIVSAGVLGEIMTRIGDYLAPKSRKGNRR